MLRINIFGKKGQNTAEYAILIGLVVAVAIAMQTYVKRGVQGRMHDASDKFYDRIATDAGWSEISTTTVSPLTEKQFEPTKLFSKTTQETLTDKETTKIEPVAQGGKLTRESLKETKEAAGDYRKYDFSKTLDPDTGE